MPCRRYPLIDSPCPRLPEVAPDAPSAWCALCRTTVHNLSALTDAQAQTLLSQPGPVCVIYRVSRRHLAALTAGALLLAGGAWAQEVVVDEQEVLDEVVVTGGGPRRPIPPLETVFLEEEPPEPPAQPGAGAKDTGDST